MDIGFIGLGNIGAHMARRLLEAGHNVVVYDTRQEAIGNLATLGAVAARSPAEVGDTAEIVMASLPTPEVVLNVATGQNGVIEGERVRRFVDLSTTGAVMAERIFDMLGTRNIVQIDSPVSGGVRGAEQGTLAVMVSEPAAWPGDVGRNTTLIVQFIPASRLPPHEPGAPAGWAKGPVNARVIPVKVEPPVLWSVSVCDALVAPTTVLPNAGSGLGVTLATAGRWPLNSNAPTSMRTGFAGSGRGLPKKSVVG